MATALKYAAIWTPICAAFSVGAVSCGKYHTEHARFEHEEWMIRQEHCAKRGGDFQKSGWSMQWSCEAISNG